MATLQKLRNMGPLLVIFVGLALFAFIAGDAWRLFQSNTAVQNVGSIDGEELSAMDFQKMYEDYCKIRHSSFIAWDRIHPNPVGSTLMAKEFLKQCDFDYSI